MKIKGFALGMVVGAVIFGSSTAIASGIMAEVSNQTIYVDGEHTPMMAYNIAGNNYVKLRDIGQTVDFGVSYDAAENTVYIDSSAGYVEESANVDSPTIAPATPAEPATTPKIINADGSITLPDGDAPLNLKEGDVIRCDDGTNYVIEDMTMYGNIMFAEAPLGDLPEPTCDWSSFPEVELPPIEVKRYNDQYGDTVFIRNNHELRRMQYTLWNLAGNHPETSEDGKLLYGSQGTPHVRTNLGIPDDKNYQVFWPWRDSEIEKIFNSVPPGTYSMDVWDVYNNGIYQRTEYQIHAI